ncbi:anti-sigma factor [Euzebya tangerina]|uniref:anti-sigma factor n=1 Tax=Euzebya tangerina TaxID=591198 RepID=UPI000E318FB0|nr:anti-sigma factor [Euzebya tangerina]
MSLPPEHDLIGAYVLDALDAEERAAVEQYLSTSPEAAAEVAELRDALTALAETAAEAPPASLKGRVMAAVDETWQVPGPVAVIGEESDLVVEHDLSSEQPEATAEPDREDVVISLADRARDRDDRRGATGVWTRLALGAGAVAAGVAVVLAVSLANLNERLDSIEQQADQIAAVVAADDARQVTVDVEGGGTLNAVLSVSDGAAVVVSDGLSVISDDEIYALWTIDGGVPAPVGQLTDGEALAVTADFELIGLTVEPDGPLDQPTGDILALLEA